MGKFPLKLVFRTTPYHLLTCYSTLALCTTAQSPSFRLSLNAPTFSTFAPSWPLSQRTAQHYQEPGRICVWCLEPREEVVLNFPPDLTDDDEDDKTRPVLVDRWCCYSVQMSPGSTWQKFTVCNIKGYVLLSGTHWLAWGNCVTFRSKLRFSLWLFGGEETPSGMLFIEAIQTCDSNACLYVTIDDCLGI